MRASFSNEPQSSQLEAFDTVGQTLRVEVDEQPSPDS